MSNAAVLISRQGPTTYITINRPAARNSLNRESVQLLIEAFSAIVTCPETRVVVLTGSGTDVFCAGADIAELSATTSPDARREFFVSIATLIEKIESCPVPVIARVYGFALAGGCGIVAAADIALASEEAVFGLPEVAIGLAPMVVMAPLIRAIGPRALSTLALTGERISAEKAAQIGLISGVSPKQDLAATVDELCATIASRGPLALRATKRALSDLMQTNAYTVIYELADRSALVSLSLEASEGLAAFREKRPPSWKGSLKEK